MRSVGILKSAEYWIEKLDLKPHEEGGHYRETYRSEENVRKRCLPNRYRSDRVFSTAIYFLLKGDEVSRFHRLQSDEIWHYYDGSPVTLHVIDPEGALRTLNLGPSNFQVVIKSGWWFGVEVSEPGSYCLMGCTVAPGFKFEDFEQGKRDQLLLHYPSHRDIIHRLTV